MNVALSPGRAENLTAMERTAIYFDGRSNRRRQVTLAFKDDLEISEPSEPPVRWPYADIRRTDSPAAVLRLTSLTAPPLARLEIRDAATAAQFASRCPQLDEKLPGQRGVGLIIGWSLAAAASIVVVILFGLPLAADRLAPIVPRALERRIGEAAEVQIKTIFGDKTCEATAGQRAFDKLLLSLREAAGLDTSVDSEVLYTPIPNALALPGGKVILFSGLLAKAENPDEIAGVLAHEFGHLKHRDSMRNLIHNSGTSFLVGLLFGDVTGAGALIFASRTLVTSSYSRDVEQSADTFAMDVMKKLGRSPKPMGELLFRVTGKQADGELNILASHPLTEDRLKRMSEADRPPTGPPLLMPAEWTALQAICGTKS
jgi:Zn-dependent protease with chaperone function